MQIKYLAFKYIQMTSLRESEFFFHIKNLIYYVTEPCYNESSKPSKP